MPEQERFRAVWKGKKKTPKAIEQCKHLGLCLIFRRLSPDHVANDCPNKGKSLETGNGQGTWQRDTPAGVETNSPLSECEGGDPVPTPTIQVSPTRLHLFGK